MAQAAADMWVSGNASTRFDSINIAAALSIYETAIVVPCSLNNVASCEHNASGIDWNKREEAGTDHSGLRPTHTPPRRASRYRCNFLRPQHQDILSIAQMPLHDDDSWQDTLSRTGDTQSPDPFPQLSSPERLAWPLTPPPGYAESEAGSIAPSTQWPQRMYMTYPNDIEESGHPAPTLEPYPTSRAFLPTSRRLPTPYPGHATLPRLNEHSGQSTPRISPNQSSSRPIAGEGTLPSNQWPFPGRPVHQPSRQEQTSPWGRSPVNIEPRPPLAQNPYNYGYNNARLTSNATFASNPSTSHPTFDHTFHRGQPAPRVTFPEPSTVPYAYNYRPQNSPMVGRGQNVWTYQTQPGPPSWGAQGPTSYWTQSVLPPSAQPSRGTQDPTCHSTPPPSTEQSVCYPAPSDHQQSVRQPSAPGPYNPVSGNLPLTRDLEMPSGYPAQMQNASDKIRISLLANDMENDSGVSIRLLMSDSAQLYDGDRRLLASWVDDNGFIYLSFEVSSGLCQANDAIIDFGNNAPPLHKWQGLGMQSGEIHVGDATVNELAAKVAKFVHDRFLEPHKEDTKWWICRRGKAGVNVEGLAISYLQYLGGNEWQPVITHEDCS
ncbi:hypothetical protein HETIRDRAFT_315983 [Heterobasidion irregulare TC 32-1]|uniref:Uncharacterized protein n=1 Tax=Heterobasidion irregulare (strain TC 32-1) TaxID=747525 RepID=W4KBN0_HETIT|nr:uncharacterized protein HETIRDRAFT_315983 [Heterobasidion irregulare TC 32-1]ETW83139.1 hypothetical protein HETIRDRAFT_315983 [Heterobasidion irregulare TC 32-1]